MKKEANSRLEHDLRNTCTHESAHLVLLKKFGGCGSIEIIRTYENKPEEKKFVGRVNLKNIASDLRKKSIIGAAGYISEFILADIEQDSGLDEDDAFNLFNVDYDELSETDKKLTVEITYETFCEAFNLVKKYWPEIEEEANKQFQKNKLS